MKNMSDSTRAVQENYLLKLIFNLALTQFNKVYQLRSQDKDSTGSNLSISEKLALEGL